MHSAPSSNNSLHLLTSDPNASFSGENTVDASILCDARGSVIAWGESAEAFLGWRDADIVGKSAVNLIVPLQHQQAVRNDIEQFCKSGGHHGLNRRMRAMVQHKDGRLVPIEYMVTAISLDKRRYFGISIWDRSRMLRSHSAPQQNHSMLNISRDAILATDLEGRILFWNRGAEKMFGYAEPDAIGRKVGDLLAARYPLPMEDIKQQLMLNGQWEGEVDYTARDGTVITTLSRWALEHDHAQDEPRILITNTDMQVWAKHVETWASAKAGSEQQFDSLFGLHPDGVLAFDSKGKLVAANPALAILTGYSIAELLTLPLAQMVAPEDLGKLRFNFAEALRGTASTHEFTCIKKDKSRFEASITMLPQTLNHKITGLHMVVKDISQKKLDERRILYLATHDPLTGLANRNLLNDRMQHAIDQARRMQTQVGILFMDLNRFKIINDSLGHDKGDILLCAIADRLKGAVREVDTVARLGGDEFVVLLEHITSENHVTAVAQNLLKLVKQPVEIDGHVLTVSTSIGASLYPKDGNDPVALLKNADLAMYEAKRSGAGRFRLYTEDMNTKAVGQLARENSLRHAIDHGELVLYYQPRLDISKNELVGVEALVRWDHPQKGLILPANFIPLAEEIGVIDALGEWVLCNACRQIKQWQSAGLLPIKVSVNVSTIQLQSEGIVDMVEAALANANLDPHCLELEITESTLMQDLTASHETLMSMRSLGISLAIDDFGTGYSSLSYLKRLPIDTLKIDKSFVREVPHNIDDAAIVSATVAMAHSMNLRVVAEGVTSFEQMRFLESCHCDEIQGYLLCQPLPAAEAESFFKTSQLRGIYYSWNQ